jgi:hypothetical protein
VRHRQLFDRTARLFGECDRALEVEPRQQQGKFLAAIAGDYQGLVERDERERLADRAQAGVALHMSVAIIEQLSLLAVFTNPLRQNAFQLSVQETIATIALLACNCALPH